MRSLLPLAAGLLVVAPPAQDVGQDKSAAAPAPYATTTKLMQPRLFLEGVVSTQDDELGGTLAPDGREFYFAKRTPATIVSGLMVICVCRFRDGKWGRPEIASFSGQYFDFGPALSADGSKLFFTSVRPVEGQTRSDTDLWFVERQRDGSWSEPRNLGAPVNTSGLEQSACVGADGTLYFASTRPGGKGGLDIYTARWVDGHYAEPENIGAAINTEATETGPCIAPDQSYLIFTSLGRPDALIAAGSPYPRPDLYVSVRRDGKWAPARHLPAPINTDASEGSAFVSPDGQYLFFTSERNFTSIPMSRKLDYGDLERLLHCAGNGLGDIYQVDIGSAGILGTTRVR